MTTESRTKVVVVLGAGASRDAWNGEVPREKDLQPPLANQLFTYQGQERWQVLERYAGALFLQQELGPLSAAGALEIEKQLLAYAQSDDDQIRSRFKDVPLYIRDVIALVSRGYLTTPGTGTYAQLVMGLVADHRHEVLFLSLNYDDFLEQALALYNPAFAIRAIGDYVGPGRPRVIKVHGSIDWVRSMGQDVGRQDWDWHAAFESYDPEQGSGEIALHDVGANSRGARFTDANGAKHWAYPAITAPVAEKGRFVCPAEHTAALEAFVPECHKYLFIGTSGLDEDVFSLLARHMPANSYAGHVGWDSSAKPAAQAIEAACPALSADFTCHRVSHDGFASYVRDDDFAEFLAWPPEVDDIVFRPVAGGPPLTDDYI